MRIALVISLSIALLAGAAHAKDKDTDRDGLSDFQERHKYRTDPANRDSDGDGKPDGDWDERREFTYSIRTVVRVMPPVNKEALTDDYQDARVRKETEEYVELEVVHYPLNTNREAIEGIRGWRSKYARMKEYLAAGVTTNWDAKMKKGLLAELKESGIRPEKLTDKEVVEKVAPWALSRAKALDMFCTYYMHFPKGKPAILPGLEERFEKDMGDPTWSVAEQLERELFGKGMFERKTRGTCTSTAVYLTTVMRALGVPTRMVLAIPAVDASKGEQLAMVTKGVTHHGVRAKIHPTLVRTGASFAAHTYNEVYVGNRWRRLNYQKLGANILDPHCFGLLTHVHRFNDLSEVGLAETWGKRYAKGERSDVFTGSNPYTALEVSDLFGPRADVPNPEVVVKEHRHLTITQAYWWHSDVRPDWKRGDPPKGEGGHLLVHVKEWFPDQGYVQLKLFSSRADKEFVLRAKGHPDVRAVVSGWYYTQASTERREFHLHIAPEEYARMAKGVDYGLVPAKAEGDYVWRVGEGVVVRR
ncbi:MAG: transglutaminase domain-containing protein [Planctomycetota bacterium]